MSLLNPGEDDNQNPPPPPPEPTFPSDRWINESLDINIPSQTEKPNINKDSE